MSHCCVIGGTGFLGSHLVRVLKATGRQLTVVGRNPLPTRPLPETVKYVAGDYGDNYFLRGVLHDVDEVVMLAYTTVPKSSFEDPVRDILDNLPAAVKLFEIACTLGIKKLVFVSSGGTVYGRAINLPQEEDHPTNPISPYGITKLSTEKYALMFHKIESLPVVCVRPGNAYGEGQKPFVGQGFVATAIVSILQGRDLVLFGESGTIRDYLHVSDLAEAILAALEHGIPGECYNIGSGIGLSNRDVLDVIAPFAIDAGREIRLKILPSRRYDVSANVLDWKKLHLVSGWKPTIPISEGIEKTWRWYQQEYP
jgi:UDP-glucose 4-epimerase